MPEEGGQHEWRNFIRWIWVSALLPRSWPVGRESVAHRFEISLSSVERCFVSAAFTGTMIERVDDFGNVFVGDGAQVAAFWDVLTDEAVARDRACGGDAARIWAGNPSLAETMTPIFVSFDDQ